MKTVPLPLPEPQAKAVKEAARRSGLSQADVLRQSITIGLPVFVARLCPGGDYLHPPALPAGAMRETYARQEEEAPGQEARAARSPRQRLAGVGRGKKAEDL